MYYFFLLLCYCLMMYYVWQIEIANITIWLCAVPGEVCQRANEMGTFSGPLKTELAHCALSLLLSRNRTTRLVFPSQSGQNAGLRDGRQKSLSQANIFHNRLSNSVSYLYLLYFIFYLKLLSPILYYY